MVEVKVKQLKDTEKFKIGELSYMNKEGAILAEKKGILKIIEEDETNLKYIKQIIKMPVEDGWANVIVEQDTKKGLFQVWVERHGKIEGIKSGWSKLDDNLFLEKGVTETKIDVNFYDTTGLDAKLIPYFRDYLGKIKPKNKIKEKDALEVNKSGLRYIRHEKGVREVSEVYMKKDNEQDATFEEWKEDQHKKLGKTFDKVVQKQKTDDRFAFFKGFKINNFIENVRFFYENSPFFYDKAGMFWFWNEDMKKYELIDETDIMNALDSELGFEGQTVGPGMKNNYLEAFKRYGRLNIPKEAPKRWIQFKDKAFSIRSGETYNVQPNYFFTNPIPWKIGESEETPELDKLFTSWVGEKYLKTLYEIMAYCCYSDYPIQTLFCLYGDGRNGKTSFLKLLSKFIGTDNLCSTELDLLIGVGSSRFESFKLYKKLVCLMGETNFGMLNKSSLIKKLTGGDMIGYEMKNKNPFDAYNYAKMLIASNSLPTSIDTSEGFYRRWLIIDFPNKFPEGKDITESIPLVEFENLSRKSVKIVKELIERGNFTNQGDINERKMKYIMASNPLPMFIDKFCNKEDNEFILYNEFYTQYIRYLQKERKRRVSRKEFRAALEDEGFWIEKASKKVDPTTEIYKSGLYIDGISLNLELLELYEIMPNSSTRDITSKEKCHKVQKVPKNEQEEEKTHEKTNNPFPFQDDHKKSNEVERIKTHHKCVSCGSLDTYFFGTDNPPLCEDCYNSRETNKNSMKR